MIQVRSKRCNYVTLTRLPSSSPEPDPGQGLCSRGGEAVPSDRRHGPGGRGLAQGPLRVPGRSFRAHHRLHASLQPKELQRYISRDAPVYLGFQVTTLVVVEGER